MLDAGDLVQEFRAPPLRSNPPSSAQGNRRFGLHGLPGRRLAGDAAFPIVSPANPRDPAALQVHLHSPPARSRRQASRSTHA
jgi:hypothetical protein